MKLKQVIVLKTYEFKVYEYKDMTATLRYFDVILAHQYQAITFNSTLSEP